MEKKEITKAQKSSGALKKKSAETIIKDFSSKTVYRSTDDDNSNNKT